jgi:hypothetical protein
MMTLKGGNIQHFAKVNIIVVTKMCSRKIYYLILSSAGP